MVIYNMYVLVKKQISYNYQTITNWTTLKKYDFSFFILDGSAGVYIPTLQLTTLSLSLGDIDTTPAAIGYCRIVLHFPVRAWTVSIWPRNWDKVVNCKAKEYKHQQPFLD